MTNPRPHCQGGAGEKTEPTSTRSGFGARSGFGMFGSSKGGKFCSSKLLCVIVTVVVGLGLSAFALSSHGSGGVSEHLESKVFLPNAIPVSAMAKPTTRTMAKVFSPALIGATPAWTASHQSSLPDADKGYQPREPRKGGATDLRLWRCKPRVPNDHVPFLIYLLGSEGQGLGHRIFEFVGDADVGEIFLVLHEGVPLQKLRGEVGSRPCSQSAESLARSLDLRARAPGHYSGQFVMEKLMLHAHVPSEVGRVVLLDADTFVLPGFAAAIGEVLNQMHGRQFVAGSTNGAFTSDNINTGVLAVNLNKMRAWERGYCPGHYWFECVTRFWNRRGSPRYNRSLPGPLIARPGFTDLTDQGLWSAMLFDDLQLWRPLPCSFHLHVDLLRSYILRKERKLGVLGCGSRSTWKNLVNGSCSHQGYRLKRSPFVEYALAHGGWAPDDVMHPQVFHGAARLHPLARLGAMVATTRKPAQQRALLAQFPCQCFGHINHGLCMNWNITGVAGEKAGCPDDPTLAWSTEQTAGTPAIVQSFLTSLILPNRHSRRGWNSYYPDVVAAIQQLGGRKGEPLRIVEVGTAFGGNANYMLTFLPTAHVTAVDPFIANYDKSDQTSHEMVRWQAQRAASLRAWCGTALSVADCFSRAWAAAMLDDQHRRHGCRYHLIFAKSLDAVGQFADGSLDVAFIDGLHTAEGVTADMVAWWPKVAPGGAMIMNDYQYPAFPNLTRAVDAWASQHGLHLKVGKRGLAPGIWNAMVVRRGSQER